MRVLAVLIRIALDRNLGLRRDVVFGVAVEIVVTGLGIVGPFALKLVIDGLTTRSISVLPLVAAMALFVGSWSLGAVLSTERMAFSTRVIDRMTQRLVTRGVRVRLPVHARNREGDSGELLGLFERLPYALTVVVDGLIWRAAPLAVQVAGSLIILSGVIPWAYALGLGLVLLAYAVATALGAIRHHGDATVANQTAAAVSAYLGDILRNARRVVFNGALDLEVDRIAGRFEEKTAANQSMTGSLVAMAVVQYGLIGLGLLTVMGFAARDALTGQLSVSAFVLLQAYAFRLIIPLSGIGFMFSQAAGALEIVRDVLDLGIEEPRQGDAPITISGPAEVRLDRVGLRYKDAAAGLHDVSAVIPAGAFVAIVGSNGSGKSTLSQVLAGLLEASTGRVTINGQDMATVAPIDRHKLVLYVPQMMTLLNRSLGENALYPPTTQTEAGIASLLADWRFDDASPGIDLSRRAGEGGERLSGGQLQKLELARITGIQVPVLILDESTSALDPISEVHIIGALREGLAARTTLIVITHRRTLAEIADQVLFVERGTLVGQGTHGALMTLSAYADLWCTERRSR